VVRDRDGDESGWEAGEADEFSNPREPKNVERKDDQGSGDKRHR
jgi:hypothetical protein